MEIIAAFIRNLPPAVWYALGCLTPLAACVFVAYLVIYFEGTSGRLE